MVKNWIIKIKRDPGPNFVINEHTKVCSEHFTSSDYYPASKKPNSRCHLKPRVVPSVFEWTSKTTQRHSITSMKALDFSEHASDDHNDSEVNNASDVGSLKIITVEIRKTLVLQLLCLMK